LQNFDFTKWFPWIPRLIWVELVAQRKDVSCVPSTTALLETAYRYCHETTASALDDDEVY
jgi:hypothetical protein